ncbi:COP23 domain-containing protein [Chlorogloea sp. CCALA 695]|uniref:COP23 domain-containing protein n=1 Tax=Chlorogloea sp. CCALA 695 TaxID=2107693 RepID=UPI000D068B06|nr:COP23 domain-containing protein [Chlorogloea sp. CCALA 695]PSB26670.1 hypothetical protein C7B70_23570 [Chlorogloea sp. CCALA 695]
MKIKSIIALLAGCAFTTFGVTAMVNQVQGSEDVRFICATGFDKRTNKRYPTTYAWTGGQKRTIIRWKYKWFNSPANTPQKRCQDISARLQTAYNNGSLKFITNSRINNQPVICTARNNGGACNTTLLTLRPDDDPLVVLTSLKDALRGRGSSPLEHSSGDKQVYYQIDIDKFLQTAPIEEE